MKTDTKSTHTINEGFTLEVIGALCDAFGKHPQTMVKWIKKNDIRLTTPLAQKVLRRYSLDQIVMENAELPYAQPIANND